MLENKGMKYLKASFGVKLMLKMTNNLMK